MILFIFDNHKFSYPCFFVKFNVKHQKRAVKWGAANCQIVKRSLNNYQPK